MKVAKGLQTAVLALVKVGTALLQNESEVVPLLHPGHALRVGGYQADQRVLLDAVVDGGMDVASLSLEITR